MKKVRKRISLLLSLLLLVSVCGNMASAKAAETDALTELGDGSRSQSIDVRSEGNV